MLVSAHAVLGSDFHPGEYAGRGSQDVQQHPRDRFTTASRALCIVKQPSTGNSVASTLLEQGSAKGPREAR